MDGVGRRQRRQRRHSKKQNPSPNRTLLTAARSQVRTGGTSSQTHDEHQQGVWIGGEEREGERSAELLSFEFGEKWFVLVIFFKNSIVPSIALFVQQK